MSLALVFPGDPSVLDTRACLGKSLVTVRSLTLHGFGFIPKMVADGEGNMEVSKSAHLGIVWNQGLCSGLAFLFEISAILPADLSP